MEDKAERDRKAIITLYTELNRFGQNGEYERAIKTANKILNIAPQESLAFHYKLVCLIELAKFDEAVQLINRNPQLSSDLAFEKAYCYYRVNKHDEALKILDAQEEPDSRSKELQAQILYRLENYNEAANLYRDIIKNSEDDYEDERLTNLSASLIYLNNEEAQNNMDDLRDNTYELCFNKACLLVANGSYADAEKKLRQCEKLCRDMLEEDETSEEDIDVDLAIIRIQLAYVYQKQGRIKEAQQLYTTNLKIKLEDVALVAVASNNVVCINKDQNLFDSRKKMKAAVSDILVHKLPSLQRKYIALNNAIMNYYIHQVDQCERICKQIDKTWPDLSAYTTILRALMLLKGDDAKEAIALLEKFAPSSGDNLYVKLCIAQLYLTQNDKPRACQIFENLGDDSYKPGIVGALTTLYLGLGDEKKALNVFERSVDWYKKNQVEEVNLTSMWRQAADFHIRNGHPQVAANCLEELLKANNGDKRITAQLALACSQFDKKRALSLSKQLPSIKTLSANVDVEALQLSATPSLSFKKSPSTKQETQSQTGTPRSDGTEKKKKHKKRKGKLPKNYDPNVQPDPERWLPRYERTGFRKKRDRRVKEVIKGSQGTASGQADQYDFSSKVTEKDDSPAVDPSPRLNKPQHPQKKGPQKKKNKRR